MMHFLKISPKFRGPWTLLKKEMLRFWRVGFQTVAAPVITALLYLLIFSHVLEGHVQVYENVPYTAFFNTRPNYDVSTAKCFCQQFI